MKRFAALFFLFSWVFGYAAPIRFPLIVLDAAALLLLVLHWKMLMTLKSWNTPGTPGVLGMLGLLLISWIAGLRIFSLNEALPGFLYLLRVSIYAVILIFAKKLFENVRHWIPVALWMFLMLGFFQYVFLPDTRFLLHSGWDEHYYRLIGTVLDPNYMGAMAGMLGLFGLFEFLEKKEKKWLLLAAMSFVSLILTFSRASWVSVVTGLLILFFQAQKETPYKESPFPAGLVPMLIGVLFVVFTAYSVAPRPGGEGVRLTRTVSVFERLVSWQNAIKIWHNHRLIGVGFNNYKMAAFRYGFLADPSSHAANAPSSSWLLLGATLGVLGILGVFVALKKTMRQLAHDPFWSAIAVLVGIHALFNNTLFYVPILALLAILKGMPRVTKVSR